MGVASFGPVDAKPSSPTYGFITSTPKPGTSSLLSIYTLLLINFIHTGWQNTDVLGLLGVKDVFSHIPFIFDTDVNAPAMAQYHLHLHKDSQDSESSEHQPISSCAYITVGTGVGVGLVINGNYFVLTKQCKC